MTHVTSAEAGQMSPTLVVAAESRSMIWNAVAVDQGHVFVAGPRWSGSNGPSLALLDQQGSTIPFPDAAWNDWRPGADPRHAFVNVNAIHLDNKRSLWAVDTGSPTFGGDPLTNGAKLVEIELASGQVKRVVALGPDLALKGSYVDDVRFLGDFAYLTDAGRAGLIVLNLATGSRRRVLEDSLSTTARPDRPIVVDGKKLLAPDGKPLLVHVDPMELTPDGQWLYFGTLEGPWSKIETRWLNDFSVGPETIASKVLPWADLPPVGGTAMDTNGDFYFTALATNTLMRRAPDGHTTAVVHDKRLHWVDAPFIDADHMIWLPVPQLDRAAIFNDGTSLIEWPVQLFRLDLGSFR